MAAAAELGGSLRKNGVGNGFASVACWKSGLVWACRVEPELRLAVYGWLGGRLIA